MAASSYCRRAKLQGIGSSLVFGQKEAAALIVQSRRWLYGRVKGLLYDGFFSFAIVRQQVSFVSLILTGNSHKIVTVKCDFDKITGQNLTIL